MSTKAPTRRRFAESASSPTKVHVRTNSGRLAEAVGDSGSRTWRVRLISAGTGSSAHYPAEVLERDGKVAFPIGTKAYLNHPSYDESWNRPERDVEKICAKQVSEVEWDATDSSLYANYEFGREHTVFVEDFHDVLGMSVYVYAESEFDTIDEYTGPIVTRLLEDRENSCDVVTVAGANGAIISRVSEGFKSFGRSGNPVRETTAPPTTEGKQLEIKDVTEAIAAGNAALVTALVEALKPKAAEPVLESNLAAEFKLAAEADLPKEAREVVFTAIEAGVPAVEAIAAQTKLVESLTKAIKEAAGRPDDIAGRQLESGAGYRLGGFGGRK